MTRSVRPFLLAAAAAWAAQGAARAAPAASPAAAAEVRPSGGAPDASPRPLSGRSIYQLDAAWTDDTGQVITLAALQGHPVVLAMIYTRCQSACPMIVAAMRKIQAALPAAGRGAARFLLISFDSAHDTSAVLQAYRREAGLPAGTWILAHGDPAAVRELAMILGVKYQKIGEGQYAHSNLITVLNDRGEIAYQRTGLEGDRRAVVEAVARAAQ